MKRKKKNEKKERKKKKIEKETPCSSPSSDGPVRRRCPSWGCLSLSALRLPRAGHVLTALG